MQLPTNMSNTDARNYLLAGMQVRRAEIDRTLEDLRAQLSPSEPAHQAAAQDKPKRHTMSAAGRKAIAAAQRERWARVKAEQAPAKAEPRKRKLSVAGRRAISRAVKARWAKARTMAAGA